MKAITVWLDVVSPYAWLAFQRLPQVLDGLSVSVRYRPVLFAGLLQHWGQRGPAEIAPKRDWTYRQVLWLARRHGLALDLPAAHPFRPVDLLRILLAHGLASGLPGQANRYAWQQVFEHAWTAGQAADDAQRLPALCERLHPGQGEALWASAQSDAVRTLLRENTAQACAEGVFGVPTYQAEGRLFWGFDALEMLAQHLRGEPGLNDADWQAAAQLPLGVSRVPVAPPR